MVSNVIASPTTGCESATGGDTEDEEPGPGPLTSPMMPARKSPENAQLHSELKIALKQRKSPENAQLHSELKIALKQIPHPESIHQ